MVWVQEALFLGRLYFCLIYEKISLLTLFYWFSKISTLSKHIVPRNLNPRSNEIFVRKNLIKVNLFFNKYYLIDEFQCFSLTILLIRIEYILCNILKTKSSSGFRGLLLVFVFFGGGYLLI